ncbi:hypothetical protein R0V13_03220 [Facklamia hominis]|uniref:hypothetical protein n=1 Tax=Facklamia hominis TaxID=178214 RepID=UPI0029D41C70|nr:hypothetical protein [Facklamia hominis]WPJ91393.1 hypothetical protein R0V13_03220 [Facklamia hominis]
MIELKGISKSYGKKVVLDQVDLQIPKGQVTFLVGENGSGDSDIMMTDTINPLKSKFKGFHKIFKQDDLGLSLSSFLLN